MAQRIFFPLISSYRKIVFLLAILFLAEAFLPAFYPNFSALSAAMQKKNKKQKAKKGKAGKKKKVRGLPKPRLKDKTEIRELAPGVLYKKMIAGKGKYSLHVVEADLRSESLEVLPLKGGGRVNALEKLSDIVHRSDSLCGECVVAAINANFWKSYFRTPIGMTVVRGEPVEIAPYKQWSSAFFDAENRLTIDHFSLEGTLSTPKGRQWSVSRVNRRADSLGVVVYNSFAGDTIPHVENISAEQLQNDIAANTPPEFDSTETPINLNDILETIRLNRRQKDLEFPLPKLRVRYLRQPRINEATPCVVMSAQTGIVTVPSGGAIISFGRDNPLTGIPHAGDTLLLKFSTNIYQETPFLNAVSGTPRLVRNGKAGHEAAIEGSTAKRFIGGNLPRTAIGTDKKRNKLIFVVADGTNYAQGTRGMTLAELAAMMKQLGASNAINLDGGGSTSMVINAENVARNGGAEFNRRISVGLAVVKKSHRSKTEKSTR